MAAGWKKSNNFRKKAFLVLGLAILSLLFLSGNALAVGEADVTLVASPDIVSIGETFDVSLEVANVADLYGASIDVVYDPALVEPVRDELEKVVVTNGTIFTPDASMPMVVKDEAAVGNLSVITMELVSQTGHTIGVENQTVFTLQFRALANGTFNLDIGPDGLEPSSPVVVKLSDSNATAIPFIGQNAVVTIGAPVAPEITDVYSTPDPLLPGTPFSLDIYGSNFGTDLNAWRLVLASYGEGDARTEIGELSIDSANFDDSYFSASLAGGVPTGSYQLELIQAGDITGQIRAFFPLGIDELVPETFYPSVFGVEPYRSSETNADLNLIINGANLAGNTDDYTVEVVTEDQGGGPHAVPSLVKTATVTSFDASRESMTIQVSGGLPTGNYRLKVAYKGHFLSQDFWIYPAFIIRPAGPYVEETFNPYSSGPVILPESYDDSYENGTPTNYWKSWSIFNLVPEAPEFSVVLSPRDGGGEVTINSVEGYLDPGEVPGTWDVSYYYPAGLSGVYDAFLTVTNVLDGNNAPLSLNLPLLIVGDPAITMFNPTITPEGISGFDFFLDAENMKPNVPVEVTIYPWDVQGASPVGAGRDLEVNIWGNGSGTVDGWLELGASGLNSGQYGVVLTIDGVSSLPFGPIIVTGDPLLKGYLEPYLNRVNPPEEANVVRIPGYNLAGHSYQGTLLSSYPPAAVEGSTVTLTPAADENGEYLNAVITTPAGFEPGYYSLNLQGVGFNLQYMGWAHLDLEFVNAPFIYSLEPYNPNPGDSIKLFGWGIAGQTVVVNLSGTAYQDLPVMTGDDGREYVTLQTPDTLVPGDYYNLYWTINPGGSQVDGSLSIEVPYAPPQPEVHVVVPEVVPEDPLTETGPDSGAEFDVFVDTANLPQEVQTTDVLVALINQDTRGLRFVMAPAAGPDANGRFTVHFSNIPAGEYEVKAVVGNDSTGRWGDNSWIFIDTFNQSALVTDIWPWALPPGDGHVSLSLDGYHIHAAPGAAVIELRAGADNDQDGLPDTVYADSRPVAEETWPGVWINVEGDYLNADLRVLDAEGLATGDYQVVLFIDEQPVRSRASILRVADTVFLEGWAEPYYLGVGATNFKLRLPALNLGSLSDAEVAGITVSLIQDDVNLTNRATSTDVTRRIEPGTNWGDLIATFDGPLPMLPMSLKVEARDQSGALLSGSEDITVEVIDWPTFNGVMPVYSSPKLLPGRSSYSVTLDAWNLVGTYTVKVFASGSDPNTPLQTLELSPTPDGRKLNLVIDIGEPRAEGSFIYIEVYDSEQDLMFYTSLEIGWPYPKHIAVPEYVKETQNEDGYYASVDVPFYLEPFAGGPLNLAIGTGEVEAWLDGGSDARMNGAITGPDEQGAYHAVFPRLLAGEYWLTVRVGSGQNGTGPIDVLPPDGMAVVNQTGPRYLEAGINDFHLHLEGYGLEALDLAGRTLLLWFDANNNGVQDEGEPTVATSEATYSGLSHNGDALEADMRVLNTAELTPGPYKLLLTGTGVLMEAPDIMVFHGAFLYGGISPWAVGANQTNFTLHLDAGNVDKITAGAIITVKLVDPSRPENERTVDQTSNVTLVPGGFGRSQGLDATFSLETQLNFDGDSRWFGLEAYVDDFRMPGEAWVNFVKYPVILGAQPKLLLPGRSTYSVELKGWNLEGTYSVSITDLNNLGGETYVDTVLVTHTGDGTTLPLQINMDGQANHTLRLEVTGTNISFDEYLDIRWPHPNIGMVPGEVRETQHADGHYAELNIPFYLEPFAGGPIANGEVEAWLNRGPDVRINGVVTGPDVQGAYHADFTRLLAGEYWLTVRVGDEANGDYDGFGPINILPPQGMAVVNRTGPEYLEAGINDFHLHLEGYGLETLDLAGRTLLLWFDANNNGVQDEGEPTVATSEGTYNGVSHNGDALEADMHVQNETELTPGLYKLLLTGTGVLMETPDIIVFHGAFLSGGVNPWAVGANETNFKLRLDVGNVETISAGAIITVKLVDPSRPENERTVAQTSNVTIVPGGFGHPQGFVATFELESQLNVDGDQKWFGLEAFVDDFRMPGEAGVNFVKYPVILGAQPRLLLPGRSTYSVELKGWNLEGTYSVSITDLNNLGGETYVDTVLVTHTGDGTTLSLQINMDGQANHTLRLEVTGTNISFDEYLDIRWPHPSTGMVPDELHETLHVGGYYAELDIPFYLEPFAGGPLAGNELQVGLNNGYWGTIEGPDAAGMYLAKLTGILPGNYTVILRAGLGEKPDDASWSFLPIKVLPPDGYSAAVTGTSPKRLGAYKTNLQLRLTGYGLETLDLNGRDIHLWKDLNGNGYLDSGEVFATTQEDSGGLYMEKGGISGNLHSLNPAGLEPGQYKVTLTGTNVFLQAPDVDVLDVLFLYGGVNPWAVGVDETSFTLRLDAGNIDTLVASDELTAQIVNHSTGTVIASTNQVSAVLGGPNQPPTLQAVFNIPVSVAVEGEERKYDVVVMRNGSIIPGNGVVAFVKYPVTVAARYEEVDTDQDGNPEPYVVLEGYNLGQLNEAATGNVRSDVSVRLGTNENPSPNLPGVTAITATHNELRARLSSPLAGGSYWAQAVTQIGTLEEKTISKTQGFQVSGLQRIVLNPGSLEYGLPLTFNFVLPAGIQPVSGTVSAVVVNPADFSPYPGEANPIAAQAEFNEGTGSYSVTLPGSLKVWNWALAILDGMLTGGQEPNPMGIGYFNISPRLLTQEVNVRTNGFDLTVDLNGVPLEANWSPWAVVMDPAYPPGPEGRPLVLNGQQVAAPLEAAADRSGWYTAGFNVRIPSGSYLVKVFEGQSQPDSVPPFAKAEIFLPEQPVPVLTQLILSGAPGELNVGDIHVLSSTLTLSGKDQQQVDYNLDGKAITWLSSNTDVAIIDEDGVLSALALGTTEITATVEGVVSNQVTVNVVPVQASQIAMVIPWTAVLPGGHIPLGVKGVDEESNPVALPEGFAPTWSVLSGDATIDENGVLIAGSGTGPVNVRVSGLGLTAEGTIAIIDTSGSRISIEPALNRLSTNGTMTIGVYVRNVQGFIGGQFHLSFDPELIQVTGIRMGDIILNSAYSPNEFGVGWDNDAGTVDFSRMYMNINPSSPPPGENGLFAEIEIQGNPYNEGMSVFTFSESPSLNEYGVSLLTPTDPDGVPINNFSRIGNIVEVVAGTNVTGYIKLTGVTKTSPDFSGISVYLQGTTYSTQTDTSGLFVLSGVSDGSYVLVVSKAGYISRSIPVVVGNGEVTYGTLERPLYATQANPIEIWPGDMNGDKKINILDVFQVAQVFNSVMGDARYNAKADFNQDNKINILDVFKVAQFFNKVAADYDK